MITKEKRSTFTRRKFLRRMGLATASPLLLGVGNQLVGRALGAPAERRLGIFFGQGETVPTGGQYGFMPPGVPGAGRPRPPVDMSGVTWPGLLAPLEPWKSKMVIVDDLQPYARKEQANHGYQYVLWSGKGDLLAAGSPGFNFPAAISLDQHVAQKIGGDTPLSSLLFGQSAGSLDPAGYSFAAGPNKPVSLFKRPSQMYAKLVGLKGEAQVTGGMRNDKFLDTKLFDLMNEDLKALDRGLAGEERALLADYLQAMESYQKKRERLREAAANISCGNPAMPVEEKGDARMFGDIRVKGMFQMATLALQCGATNVVGISIGNDNYHDDLEHFSKVPAFQGVYQGGHGAGELYAIWIHALYQFTLGQLAELMTNIGPLADRLTVAVLASNGTMFGGHHGGGERVPAFIYDGTGRIKTGARYVRYGGAARHLGDLHTTLAHAFGAPVEKFNDVGTGVLPGLLA